MNLSFFVFLELRVLFSPFFPFFPFFSHALFFLLHNIYYKAKVDIDPRPLIYTPNHFIDSKLSDIDPKLLLSHFFFYFIFLSVLSTAKTRSILILDL